MAGRKSAYEEKIKPQFKKIEKCLSQNPPMTEKQTAKLVGVSYSTWNRHKAEKKEFSELIKNSRRVIVEELYSALAKLALGFTHEEYKKTVKKNSEGKEEQEVTIRRYCPPNLGAIHLCLKNWAKDEWANDPALLDIKKQELALKKEEAKNKIW